MLTQHSKRITAHVKLINIIIKRLTTHVSQQLLLAEEGKEPGEDGRRDSQMPQRMGWDYIRRDVIIRPHRLRKTCQQKRKS